MDDYFNNAGKYASDRVQLDLMEIDKLITPKQRKKYINYIFNDNEKDFKKFIKLIRNITNWKDASILIDFYFYKNGARPESKEAIEFKDIIYRIYFPINK